MEDRYLFKAKHIHILKNSHLDGVWVKGYLVDEKYIVSVDDGCECLVDPNTICQCTGLKDDNGNLIFENDILSLEDSVNEIKWKAVVKYGNPNCEYTYGWQLVELTKCEANKDILLWVETEMEYMKCKAIANKFD